MRGIVEFYAFGSNLDEVYSDMSKRWNDMTAGKYGNIPQNAEVKIRNNNDRSDKEDDLIAYVTVRIKVGE